MSKPYNDWPNDAGFDVLHEEREPVELKVSGHIPHYVSGTLYRTGPGGNRVKTDDGKTYTVDHWFDGFSQNHRFQIIQSHNSTRVVYNSRRSVDPLIESIRKTGKLPGVSFAQKRDPCVTFFKKAMSMFIPEPKPPQDQANIGVTLSVNPPGLKEVDTSEGRRKKGGHASGIQSLWAKTDASQFREIEPETLEPMGYAMQTVLHPELTGIFSAAHAKSDPATGDVFNYNLSLGSTATYKIFRVSAATGKTNILATITDAPAAYLHSSLITENYFVLCVWGGQYLWGGTKILWEKNMLDAMTFDPSRRALWYVVDRKHGKGVVAKYECNAFFCFHTINAWEEPSTLDPAQTDIVADLATYNNIDILKRLFYNNVKSTSPGALTYVGENYRSNWVFLRRWRLPGVNTTIDAPAEVREAVAVHTAEPDHSCDLPVINPRFLTRPSRYIYGVCDRGLSTFFDGIVKYDTETHTPTYWSVQGHSPGEPIFVVDPEGTAEDDGVLLSVVLDGFTEKSYLVALDAKSMEEVGRASMECVVGFGFHGIYYPRASEGPGTDI